MNGIILKGIKILQKGFTMIELIVVIVILGILAAMAIPKFIDLSSNAGTSATQGVAGAVSSGSATNYAAKLVGNAYTVINGTNAATCTTAVLTPLISGVTLANGAGAAASNTTFNVTAGVTNTTSCVGNAGAATGCVFQGQKGSSFEATVICTGP